MNKAMIIGNLTRDPEFTKTASGIAVCRFTVAVARPNNRNETDFIQVVAWRGLASLCDKYLVKGRKAAVSGFIQTGYYDDKKGVRRYTTEINADGVEFLTPKGQGGGRAERDVEVPVDDALPDDMGDFEPLDDEQMPF